MLLSRMHKLLNLSFHDRKLYTCIKTVMVMDNYRLHEADLSLFVAVVYENILKMLKKTRNNYVFNILTLLHHAASQSQTFASFMPSS